MNKKSIRYFFTKTPEETVKELYKKIPPIMVSVFWVTFVFGILTHIFIFTNMLVNQDSAIFLISDKDIMLSGRWFIREASALSGIFQLPVVIGLLSITFISLSAAFTVYILKINNKLFGCLVGMVMVSIPIIAGIFAFMFTADAYAISLFLSVLSVFFAQKKGWKNGVLAGISLMFSVAIYQAYCQYAITLFVLLVLIDVMDDKIKMQQIFKEGVKYCAVFAGGLIAYRVVLTVIFSLQKTESSFASLTMTDNFVNRIRTVFSLFRRNLIEFRGIFGYEIVKYIYILFVLLSICFIVSYIGKQPKGNRFVRLCMAGVLFCCIPVAQNILVIATDTRVHNLTRYAFVLSVIFIVKLVDMVEATWRKNIYTWVICLAFGIVLWCNFLFTNECYLSLQLTNETSYALANRIVDRIETTVGWEENMPVLIVGNYDAALDDGKLCDTKPILHTRIEDVFGIVRLDYVYYRPHILYAYINDYIGKPLVKVTEEELERVQETGEVENMGNFPAEDSIKIIDGVLVVRLYEPDWSVVNILNDSTNFVR